MTNHPFWLWSTDHKSTRYQEHALFNGHRTVLIAKGLDANDKPCWCVTTSRDEDDSVVANVNIWDTRKDAMDWCEQMYPDLRIIAEHGRDTFRLQLGNPTLMELN